MRAPSPSHSAVGSCLPSRIDVQDALSASGCASQQRSACPWQVTMLIATFTIFVFGGSITSVAKYYDVLEPKTKVCAYPLEASAIRRGPSAEVPQPRSLSRGPVSRGPVSRGPSAEVPQHIRGARLPAAPHSSSCPCPLGE